MTDDVEQILATATLVTELLGNSISVVGLYLTVLSGYLLVAYLAGRELSFLQTTIITTLFVSFSIFNTVVMVSYLQTAYFYGHTYGLARLPGWATEVSAIMLAGGILAAVKFMWDIRHPKKE